MNRIMRGDKGAALGLVLIFVSVFSLWLSATMLMSQTAAAAVSRAEQANQEASQAAMGVAQALGILENNQLATGLDVQQDCLPSTLLPGTTNQTTGGQTTQVFTTTDPATGTVLTIECSPVADGTTATAVSDGIILTGTSGTVGVGQGIKAISPVGSPITISNPSNGSTKMVNSGTTTADGSVSVKGSAGVQSGSGKCTSTTSPDPTAPLSADTCLKGSDRIDKNLATSATDTSTKRGNVAGTQTLATCPSTYAAGVGSVDANGVKTTVTTKTQVSVRTQGGRTTISTSQVADVTYYSIKLNPGTYGAAQVDALTGASGVLVNTSTRTNPCGANWATALADTTGATVAHVYFAPGVYVFTDGVFKINNAGLVVTSREPKVDQSHLLTSTITQVAQTATTVTVTTSAAHKLQAGESVAVSGLTANTSTVALNGNWKVASTPTETSFTFTRSTSATIAATADSGKARSLMWVCERTAPAEMSDADLALNPDGTEWRFMDNARLELNNGQISLCPTSYSLQTQRSIYGGITSGTTSPRATAATPVAVVSMNPLVAGASPIFVAEGQVNAPLDFLSFKTPTLANVRLNGGTYVQAMTIQVTATSCSPASTCNLMVGSQGTGDRYVTLKVTAKKKDGTTKVLGEYRVKVRDSYGTSSPSGFTLEKRKSR